jgi:ABC-type glycerol-3-phosphate transport system permease component
MAAYALARMRFPGRRVVLGLMGAAIMIPPALLIIPLFFLVRDAGLLDTYWALILPALANPVGVFILSRSSAACRRSSRRRRGSTTRRRGRSTAM